MEWEPRPGRDERLAGNLDTSLLKTLALLFMLIDHLGVALFGNLLEMRVLGRIALPLYAWCLIVGNVKTRHPLRYFGRLLLVAVLSQPLYMMGAQPQLAAPEHSFPAGAGDRRHSEHPAAPFWKSVLGPGPVLSGTGLL